MPILTQIVYNKLSYKPVVKNARYLSNQHETLRTMLKNLYSTFRQNTCISAVYYLFIISQYIMIK